MTLSAKYKLISCVILYEKGLTTSTFRPNFSKLHQYSMGSCFTSTQNLNIINILAIYNMHTTYFMIHALYELFLNNTARKCFTRYVNPCKIFSQRKASRPQLKKRNVERKKMSCCTTMSALTHLNTQTRAGKIQFIFWRCTIKSHFFYICNQRKNNQRNRIIYSENIESDLLK